MILKKGNNIVLDVLRNASKVIAIYLGEVKVYPGIVNTETGTNYSNWSYNLPYRTRTATPYSSTTYQNGTSNTTYGTPSNISEQAVLTYDDPNMWYYYSNNSYRVKSRTPIYTFPNNYIIYGESEEIREDGVDISTWSYSGSSRSIIELWHYSDINKTGRTTTEDAVTTLEHDAWRYYNMPFKRWRIITPIYDWTNTPVVQHEGTQYQEDDAPTNQESTVEYDYVNDQRTTSTLYTFSNADTWSGNPVVEDPINVSIFSLEEYDNGECDMSTYEYVDYLQVRKHYTWSGTPTDNYGPIYNGAERRQKIDGQCGWVRAWTGWTNNGQYCNAAGTVGAYDCDGDYSVDYYRQARLYCYPDGSGVTNTQYQVGSERSRNQVNGQCGFGPQRTSVDYSGFSYEDQIEAFYSEITGTIYLDSADGYYYTTQFDSEMAAAGYYMTYKGSTPGNSTFIHIHE